MIKLESRNSGLSAIAEIRVQSASNDATVRLTAESVRSQKDGQWVEDPSKRKQVLTFVGENGPVELAGTVDETQAVEIAAAWAVIAEAKLSTEMLATFQAGRKSRSMVAVDLVRVVEVWASAEKCLWRSPERQQTASKGKVIDGTGRINAAA